MKTPILKKYEERLIDVNDQLCYFLFSNAELAVHIPPKHGDDLNLKTTELFPKNPFSERLNIKIASLNTFSDKSFHTLVGMSIISSVEYVINYIKEIERFRTQVSPSEQDLITNEKPEERLREKLKIWLQAEPNTELIKTIKYLRLRRNHIAHVREKPNQELGSLVRNHSHNLNRYWKSKSANLLSLDFSDTDYSSFDPDETLALISLTRICMRNIDALVVSTIEKEDILNYEAKKFLKSTPLKGQPTSRKVRKLKGLMKVLYGSSFECSEEDFIKIENEA